MRVVIVVPALLIAALSAWTSGQQQLAAPETSDPVARDVSVFRALLRHESLGGPANRPGLVVTRDMGPWPPWLDLDNLQAEQNLRRFLRTPAPSTIDAFFRVVREAGELPDDLRRFPGIVVVRRSELEARLERPGRDYWKTFARNYPRARGIVSLSRIAYSADGQEAMAYLGYSCGILCGHGLAVVLRQLNGQWMPIEHMYLWES